MYLDSQNQGLPMEVKKNLLKEKLQSYVLYYIYNHPDYRSLNFYGGACARIVYELNRLSEDLDFDNTSKVDLSLLKNDLHSYFSGKLMQKDIDIHEQTGEWGVARWTIKIPVLYDLSLSEFEDEKLHLKIEVSSHKQISNTLMTPILDNHGLSYVARHFDLPSLMAGKIIACIERVYRKGKSNILVKGRDYYDLIWYMQKGVKPSVEKLATDGKEKYTPESVVKLLTDKMTKISKRQLEIDLRPLFLEQHFLDSWLDNYQEFFNRYLEQYI